MSVAILRYIYCDFCDSGEPHDHAPRPNAVAAEERINARFDGWSFPRVNGHAYDRCPDCTAAKRTIPYEGIH